MTVTIRRFGREQRNSGENTFALASVAMPVARREIFKYALTLAAGTTLAATAAAPRAGAAEGLRLLDFATLQLQPEQIKAAGYDGALVYVSELRPGANFDSASSVLTGRLVCSQIAESAENAI